MDKQLTAQDVYYQPENIPENLHIWQDENKGIASLVMAAKDIVAGSTVTFALCDREGTQPPTIREIVHIALGYGGEPSDGYQPVAPRYCGEYNNPNGAGSHALIAPWYDYCADPAAIATAMALAFTAQTRLFFRLPNA